MPAIETAGFTVIDVASTPVLAPESVAWIVKAKDPVADGLPEITPPLDSDSPPGKLPALTIKLYPLPVPPLAETVAE